MAVSLFGMIFVLMIVAIVATSLIAIVWLISQSVTGRRRSGGPPADPRAAEQLGRLVADLDRMERRMENLETILLERARPGATERL